MTDSLDAIGADVRACRLCKLSQTRTLGCARRGPAERRDLVHRRRARVPRGPAGQTICRRGRPAAGRDAARSSTCAARTCSSPTSCVADRQAIAIPLPDELSACDTYTQRQLDVLQPKLIVTLGRFSMARFFGQGPMRDLHGRTREWNGITCLAMYHPAAILRTPTVEMRRIYAGGFREDPACCWPRRARAGGSRSRAAAAVAELAARAGPVAAVLSRRCSISSAVPVSRYERRVGRDAGAASAARWLALLLAAFLAVIIFLPPEGRIAAPLHDGAGRAARTGQPSCCRSALAFVGLLLVVRRAAARLAAPASPDRRRRPARARPCRRASTCSVASRRRQLGSSAQLAELARCSTCLAASARCWCWLVAARPRHPGSPST